ncbi:MAG TPA: hypothetical protein VE553_03095 [Candidatus Binatia bacterium]|jgi:amino acid transporter|nr:hypothetical protein [Candidatus Binatia bacterium]
MRLLSVLVALILLFALLVRMMPPAWSLPLYMLFLVLTVAFTGWERRRIGERRRKLQRKLEKEHRDFEMRQGHDNGQA